MDYQISLSFILCKPLNVGINNIFTRQHTSFAIPQVPEYMLSMEYQEAILQTIVLLLYFLKPVCIISDYSAVLTQ